MILAFHDGSAITTGVPLYNWKNLIKLIPLLIPRSLSHRVYLVTKCILL